MRWKQFLSAMTVAAVLSLFSGVGAQASAESGAHRSPPPPPQAAPVLEIDRD
jgi:hypothetical protein